MKILGKVLHKGSKGLIIKCTFVPKLGKPVFDSRKRRVGEISDIFGPTTEPYAVIKTASEIDPSNLLGSTIYYEEEGVEKRRK
ncbi:MAG: Gar1/Naf1 family protein [Candidatus Hadarchaeales archaeon]